MEDSSRTQMEKSSMIIIRRSIYTFLQNYHYFTTIAAVFAFPYSLSVLMSHFFVPSSPLLPTIHKHLKAIFTPAQFPPSSHILTILSSKISQTVSSSIFALAFTLSFFLVSKASIIHFLKDHNTNSSIPSLYNPLLSTFICNFFLLFSANSTALSLLFFGFHFLNGFSSSPNWLIFISAAGAVLYSIILANALIICNLALVSSGMEKSGGYNAILRACVLIKGRALTALALAVPGNLVLSAIEALFHYRVVRAYYYYQSGDFNGFAMVLEGVLIAYLYSIFVVLDTIVTSLFYKSCKNREDRLMDEEERSYCYRVEIVAEKNGNTYVNLKEFEELV